MNFQCGHARTPLVGLLVQKQIPWLYRLPNHEEERENTVQCANSKEYYPQRVVLAAQPSTCGQNELFPPTKRRYWVAYVDKGVMVEINETRDKEDRVDWREGQ